MMSIAFLADTLSLAMRCHLTNLHMRNSRTLHLQIPEGGNLHGPKIKPIVICTKIPRSFSPKVVTQ